MFWASLFLSPVNDEAGDVVQHFASFVDLTKHRQEQERLQYLLDELNHRTQNTLATVLAIAGQTLRGMADDEVIADFEGRVLTLSKTQSLLGVGNGSGVGLRAVAWEVLLPFGFGDGEKARVLVEGTEVLLQPKEALTLGMLFHELASNAVKHGALSKGSAGEVRLTWTVAPGIDGEQLQLRWQESGGPDVTPPSRKGFGSRFIERGLAQDLDGEVRLDYEPSGVVCAIVMPWPAKSEARQP